MRLTTLRLAAGGLAVAGLLALPGVAAGQAPTEDSVVADGFDPGVLFLDIDVRSGPSGENPTGRVAFHIGGGLGPTYTAEPTCLGVTGNTAVIGFLGTLSFGGSVDPVAGLIRVTDAGGPGSSQDIFEGPRAVDTSPPVTPLTDCSNFPTAGGDRFSVFADPTGDIVVRDAQPLPTSKDQCKNGGWRDFGVFKNQGDCVSFFATGGDNPPSGGP
jgi:hypothetical protein